MSTKLSSLLLARSLSQTAYELHCRHSPSCPFLPINRDRAPYKDITHITVSSVITVFFAVTPFPVHEVHYILLCEVEALWLHALVQLCGHRLLTSAYRHSHGDRTSHAMVIKALFLSPKESPGCTRKDQCLLPLPDGTVLSLLFMKQLAYNSGRVP